MKLDLLIGELLLRNNCVVIPKFGGFIATQTEASINFSNGLMSAPKKSILFNKQLTNSDGLLISAFALKNQIPYDEASLVIESQIKIWEFELNDGKRIAFDKVGFLYLDNQKNILFEQDRFFNLLMQSFGMGQVQFVSEQKIEKIQTQASKVVNTEETTASEQQDFVFDKSTVFEKLESKDETQIIQLLPNLINKAEKKSGDKKIVPLNNKTNSSKKLVKYIAAACFLPIAFYSVWIPIKTDVLESGIISFNDFNPFQKNHKATYITEKFTTNFDKIPVIKSLDEQISDLPKEVEIYSMEIDDDVFFVNIKEVEIPSEQKEQFIAEDISSEKTEKVSSKPNHIARGEFQIIAGSFSNQNNAEDLVNSLKTKGFEAYSFTQENGLIRVSAGKTSTQIDAQNLVQKLSENQVSSWVLR